MVDKLKVGMSVKWRGDIYKDINGTRVTQDSYALLDLMAEYEINDKAALAFNMYNVTDEKYLTSLLWDQSFYGTPRSASLTLSLKY
jgi:outer membrane receptor for ferric coprogen and ferric-rhodotorulic acid